MSRSRKPDDLLVVALAQGKSHLEAGKIAGMSERTVRRRLQDPDFAALIDRERAAMTANLAAEFAGLYSNALDTMRDLLQHKDGRVRLGAAQFILKRGPELRTSTEIEERLLELEENVRNSS